MAKALNIDLNVNANTSLARQELSLLQNTLKQLTTASGEISRNLTTGMDLSKTIAQVSLLRALLQSATNVDTGVLNFTKLNLSIQQANTSLLDYGRTLNSLGPTGQKAFLQLATAVSKSEIPISQTNGMLKQFGTTMKNTLRWQASSMLLHGTVNAIQKAWNYAQKLDRSLTDIQIVTKQSDAQMAKFAENANKAARALSTSTTAYTDAALIYYQLGLNDALVKQRTDVTVKMANVTGRTAEKVSDQMTAIWNNFDNGSKSLEYYADVITALGAATASSSDEIATGLSKFAAVADTVGLSYENATAALATITATTRQSADSVGNGLKTLFSRLQSLSLGKTLEDGVNLTKYTKALNTVGVSALDAAGNLRSMDSILADLGERWDTLSSAQLNALAQTVGGVRLYVTFTALMDNYDFFKNNIQIAKNASGELLKQADVYDKSWAAARKHVQASAEAIYSDLIDDKFFTQLTNGFAGALGVVDNFIDGIGGIKGALFAAGTAMATFGKRGTAAFLDNSINSIRTLFPSGVRALQDERTRILKGYLNMLLRPTDLNGNELPLNYAMQQQGLALARILPLLNEFAQNLNSYNLLLLLSNLNLLDTLTVRGESIVLTAESVMAALTLLDNINTLLYNTVLPETKSRGAINIGANLINGGNFAANTPGGILSTGEGSYIRALTELLLSSVNGAADFSSQASQTELARLSKFFEGYDGFEIDDGKGGTIAASYALRNAATPEDWTRIIGSIRNAVSKSIESEIRQTSPMANPAEIKDAKNLAMQSFNIRLSIYLNEEKNRRANEELDDLAKKGFLTVPTNMSIGTGMTEAVSMLGGLGMGLSILRSGVSNLSNPNMSSGDKFLSLATSIGMATPMLSNVGKNLKEGELLPFLGNLGTVIGEKNRDLGNLLNNAYISQIRDKEVKNIAQTMSDNFNAKGYLSRPVSPNAFMKEAAELFDKESVYLNDTPSTYLSGKGYEAGNNLVTRGLSLIGKNVSFKDSKLVSGVSKLTGLGTDAAAGGVIAAGAVAALIATVEITKLVAASIESTSETITRYQGNIDTASAKAQKVSEEYSTLVSKVDVHNKQLDKLNELESGSLEYRLAQIEANKTASEIIAENGLTPDLYTFENGIYNINKSALLQAQENALDKIELANTLELAAKAVLTNYNTGLKYRDIMSQITPGYGGDMANYSFINLIKLANAQDLSKYNDNEILALIGLEYNLGSGAEVARLIQNNLLESQIMITSGAAATNQALLNSVATLMNNGKELNDLQKLIIDDLADNVTTSNELADAANNGLDSAAIAWRSLGHFRKEYIQALQDVEGMTEAEAEAQMRNLEQDEAYLNADRHGKQVILTSYIANMRTTQKALELLKDYQDALADSNVDYSDWQTLTQEELQERYLLNAEMNSIYAAGLGAEGLTEAEYNAREAIGDEFDKAKEAYFLLAAALGVEVIGKDSFLGSNFNYEDYTGIVNLTNQFRTAFGGNVGKSIFTTLSKESKQFRADLQNLVGDDAILTLFNLKSDSNFIAQYKELMAELDGKGLFEALYDSEGFKDSLADLTKEFEKSGKISADSVLALAESSETLSNYLDVSGVNAQGLANTIATLAKGDLTLDRLSSSLIYAYSAAGELGSSMADTYKFISDYDKGTSVDTIGNFYKNLESTIYKSINGGNLLDEPLLNSMEALFGLGGADRWRVLAAQASDFSNLREAKDFLFNDSSFADLWTYLLKIYKTGDLSPLYQQLLTSGNFNLSLALWQSDKNRNVLTSSESGEAGLAIKDLTDIMRWNNGLVDITDDEAFLEMFLTQEEFYDYVMSTEFGKTWGKDTVRAMINEYGGLNGKNATVSQGWYKNGIIAGGRNLTASGKLYDEQGNPVTDEAGNQLENPDLINADNLREYLLTYEATLASLSLEDLRKFMASMGVNLGGSDEAVNAYLQSLFTGPEKGKINIDAITNAVARANANMVDMGAGFKYSEADYETTKQAYNKYNGKGEDDTAFTEYLREGSQRLPIGYFQNFEDAIAKFTAIGFTEDQALKLLEDAIKTKDLTGISRQVWDENTQSLKTVYQDIKNGETVQEFQDRTGGTNAEYYAEMQKHQAEIDAYNTEAFINNLKLIQEYGSEEKAKQAIANGTEKDLKWMDKLDDIIDATGKIVDNTGTSAEIAEEQNEAATAGSEKGTNKPSKGDKAFDEEGNEVTYDEDKEGWVNENGELIENQETVTNSYSSTPTPTPTPGAPEEKPGGRYGLTITRTSNGKEVSTTASFASQDQYDQWKIDNAAAKKDLETMRSRGASLDEIDAQREEYIKQGLILPEGTVTTVVGTYASGLNNYIPGFASGYQGPATVGELGPEMWVHNGQVDIVGLQGRESIWVNPSDTILTAGLTDRLLNGRKPGFSFGYGDNYGSSGGGSRRGSGSGGKEDDDKWKDSWEPYHEISREVQRLTTDVENLNTEMERAFGVEKIQKMEDELELLDLRLQQEADYIAEAEAYIAEYAEYLPDGTEVVDGVILNYDALLEKYLKDIYEAQEKRDRDKLEKLQREWLRIQLYEQHTDKLEERRQEQLNLLYQKADLMLQQLLYSIDLVNSSLDESEDLIDYMLNHMNTDMFKMAESIAFVGDATDVTIQKMELAKQSIQDYEDMLGTEYANDEELVNSILQERNNLLKLNQELDKQRDNVIKKLTYTIQEFNNELKKATKFLTNYNTLIKNYTDLSELMGLSTINNTEQIDKLNDALKNNMDLNIQATKSQLETNQAQIAQMEADFEANPWMREAYDDVYQKLIEEGQGLSVTLSNNLQSMLNFIVKEFETELDRALTSFQDQITKGFGTWDELTSAANSLKGAQDVNTKAYDRVYQLNTLIRDMDSYMNDMTSAKNHNSILKFQELIKKLKADNTDLSQEELDVLRAQFELMLAQFDLEDAQNAKNQVRLLRDMNGNWGYVYTADEDAMAEAQLNVDDKLKAYLDAVTALLQVQGEYMGTVAELEIQEQELRNELNQLGHTDEDEERRALLLKQIAAIEEQLDMYKNNLLRMQDTLNEAVDSGHGYIQEIWDESNELFNASLGALPQMMLESIATTEEFFDVLSNAEIAFVDRTTAAKDAYMEQYEEWAPYLEQFNNGLGDMAEQSLKAVTNLDALNELYLQEFTDAMEAAVKWEQEYGQQMGAIVKLNLIFIDLLDQMINGLRGLDSMDYSVSFRRVTDDREVSAMTSMDSGGYTGAWGTSGKIAMLHEKEQVFNAQDTLNLLTAALILRTIDASANSMAIGLNNMITPKIDGVTLQIDLTVSISASFPNAVNHFEIEEAFNNLTNKAMQYANRKNA